MSVSWWLSPTLAHILPHSLTLSHTLILTHSHRRCDACVVVALTHSLTHYFTLSRTRSHSLFVTHTHTLATTRAWRRLDGSSPSLRVNPSSPKQEM